MTTHLVLNGKIITQAPSLKGAQVIALPPEEGSWKIPAFVLMLGTGIYQAGTAPPDTPIGHLVRSAYDYVVSESLGFHVDYDSTLGQQYESLQEDEVVPDLDQSRFDSLIEKCETAIKDMHRPIVWSQSAVEGQITSTIGKTSRPLRIPLNRSTYDYIHVTRRDEIPSEFVGRVSSYNINTFKGRVYILSERRPVPFELAETARDIKSVTLVTESLTANARGRADTRGDIRLFAFRNISKTGRLKSIYVVRLSR